MVHHIGLQSSILGQYLADIRTIGVQTDRLRFRPFCALVWPCAKAFCALSTTPIALKFKFQLIRKQ
jgi:hypothetical protein